MVSHMSTTPKSLRKMHPSPVLRPQGFPHHPSLSSLNTAPVNKRRRWRSIAALMLAALSLFVVVTFLTSIRGVTSEQRKQQQQQQQQHKMPLVEAINDAARNMHMNSAQGIARRFGFRLKNQTSSHVSALSRQSSSASSASSSQRGPSSSNAAASKPAAAVVVGGVVGVMQRDIRRAQQRLQRQNGVREAARAISSLSSAATTLYPTTNADTVSSSEQHLPQQHLIRNSLLARASESTSQETMLKPTSTTSSTPVVTASTVHTDEINDTSSNTSHITTATQPDVHALASTNPASAWNESSIPLAFTDAPQTTNVSIHRTTHRPFKTFPPRRHGRIPPPQNHNFWRGGIPASPSSRFPIVGGKFPSLSSIKLNQAGRYENVTTDHLAEAAAANCPATAQPQRSNSVVWLTFHTTPVLVGSNTTASQHQEVDVVATAAKARLDVIIAMASPPSYEASLYHQFFADYRATLHAVDADIDEGRETKSTGGTRFVPLQFDVVYTYVNDSSPSHLRWTTPDTPIPRLGRQRPSRYNNNNQSNQSTDNTTTRRPAVSSGAAHAASARFRDWNELLYSLRGVYRYGICRPNTSDYVVNNNKTSNNNKTGTSSRPAQSRADKPSSKWCTEGAMIRNIYIVVADMDQTPSWLSQASINSIVATEEVDGGGTGGSSSGSSKHRPPPPSGNRPFVKIVTHAEMFPPEDISFLPTFNSHAIESVLHRIPGISRYFVYFNNDMFWARQVSWFDYLRPLSPTRQAFYARRHIGENSLATNVVHEDAISAASLPVVLQPLGVSKDVVQVDGKFEVRVSIAMEPIMYFENAEDVHECRAWAKRLRRPKAPTTTASPAAAAVTTTSVLLSPTPTPAMLLNNNHTDSQSINATHTAPPPPLRTQPPATIDSVDDDDELIMEAEYIKAAFGNVVQLSQTAVAATANAVTPSPQNSGEHSQCLLNPSALFDFRCPTRIPPGVRFPRNQKANAWREFVDNNKGLVFKRVPGSHWPSHSFAHYPRLMDRRILARMQDDVFADVARMTRRSKERTVDSLWTTHVYHLFALAERRAVELELYLAALPTDLPTAAAIQTNSSSSPASSASVQLPPPAAVQWPWWRNQSLSASSDSVTLVSIRPMGQEELVNNVMQHVSFRYATTADEIGISRGQLWPLEETKEDVDRHLVPRPDTTTEEPATQTTMIPPPVTTNTEPPSGNESSAVRTNDEYFSERAPKRRNATANATNNLSNESLPPLSPARRLRPTRPPITTPPPRTAYPMGHWRQHTFVEPHCQRSLLEEKLNHHVVQLDRKRGGYYFGMVKTLAIMQRCLAETVGNHDLLGGVQLFVTINDDLPRMNSFDALFQRALAQAQTLFEALSGHAPPAPWEMEA